MVGRDDRCYEQVQRFLSVGGGGLAAQDLVLGLFTPRRERGNRLAYHVGVCIYILPSRQRLRADRGKGIWKGGGHQPSIILPHSSVLGDAGTKTRQVGR